MATWITTVLIGLGFATSMEEFPKASVITKTIGSIYVLWLAWKLFQAGRIDATQESKPANFWDGVILLLVNPKAYFIITVMFSQFLETTSKNQIAVIVWISTLFTLNNLVAFSLWTALGDHLAQYFRNETNARILNRFFGGVLGSVGIWMLLT